VSRHVKRLSTPPEVGLMVRGLQGGKASTVSMPLEKKGWCSMVHSPGRRGRPTPALPAPLTGGLPRNSGRNPAVRRLLIVYSRPEELHIWQIN
jgi:hypothetical protein